ncbi:MAG: hypothetical protein KGN79_07670 [Acidobacteriota bacterium]|nr:hypothetical protein [Acidobacteriota bacterium]
MVQETQSFWQRHRALKWVLASAASAFVVLFAVFAIAAHKAEPFLRARIVEGLSDHFHAHVELDSFHISLGYGIHGEWGLWANGRGLRIWPPRIEEAVAASGSASYNDPLINLQSFRFHVPVRIQSAWPLHIGSVRLSGLQIHIPPKQPGAYESPGRPLSISRTASIFGRVLIGRIQCNNAVLIIESSKPGKLPLEFDIAQITLDSIATDGSMHYQADLTNPRPPGLIHASGTFGPWHVDDAGESPVSGSYQFSHADLSVFAGIAGMLDSTGNYRGVLRELTVDGETNVPDFRLKSIGNPIPLHTRFHAFVDGTNGDTDLEPVAATLGSSSFTARGKIVQVREKDSPTHVAGHDITLTVNAQNTQIADFLRLVTSDSSPILTGNLAFNTSLHIPPGQNNVQDRMELKGHFNLDHASFTSDRIQGKVRELSLRAEGHPGEAKNSKDDPPSPDQAVQSTMQSDFSMENGIITLPNLKYSVPGADIHLHGTYALKDGAINFRGKARMQATVSRMVGGWKGFFLKVADPFFKKNGAGAEFPIHVSGTRDKPDFGIDLNRMKTTSPQSPADSTQTHPESPAPQ